ncbi:hypothetical protein J3R83DRAFT_7619 [Lanmaoa asiatica]|nr:hypothetical protein J3R83DRAFT_7619 [Lanmaoa asiatica]
MTATPLLPPTDHLASQSGNDAEGPTPATGAGEGTYNDSNRLYFPPSSPVGERSSIFEPPTPAQRRRECSDSAEQALEWEGQGRRKRRCAIQVCKDLELSEDALTTFAELDVPEMLIMIFGKHLWLERERMKDEVHSFIKSDEFKGFIKKNLAVFNIPPLVMEDARLMIYVDTLMKDVLTKQRSQIKTKIVANISKNHHISDLAKSLAGCDFVDVTLVQWGRFAFLRQNYILFSTIVDESLAKKVAGSDAQEDSNTPAGNEPANNGTRTWSSNQFWEFIDELLDEMREAVRHEPGTESRKQAWEKFFTDSLQSDLEQFPAENKSASLHPSDGRSAPEWQKAIHQDLAWL